MRFSEWKIWISLRINNCFTTVMHVGAKWDIRTDRQLWTSKFRLFRVGPGPRRLWRDNLDYLFKLLGPQQWTPDLKFRARTAVTRQYLLKPATVPRSAGELQVNPCSHVLGPGAATFKPKNHPLISRGRFQRSNYRKCFKLFIAPNWVQSKALPL